MRTTDQDQIGCFILLHVSDERGQQNLYFGAEMLRHWDNHDNIASQWRPDDVLPHRYFRKLALQHANSAWQCRSCHHEHLATQATYLPRHQTHIRAESPL